MRHRITTLIDFSLYTETLMQSTAWFAKALDAEVVLMHQLAGMFPAFTDMTSREQVIEKERKLTQEKLEVLAKPYGFLNLQYAISPQPLPDQLRALKSTAYFDWVFLGLKGTGLLKRLFIGSTALEVIENSSSLTVALPKNAGVVVPRRLVVAVSESYPLNRAQLQQLVTGLQGEISAIEFITVDTGKEGEGASAQTLAELQQAFAAYNSSYQLFSGDNALGAIQKHMEQRSQAYLVLQRGTRTFEDSVLRRFLINDLVYNAAIPLVVLS